METLTTQVDRSRILTAQACPRKRYLEYHFAGAGLQKVQKSLPLIFGGAVHEGLEDLMLQKGIESAVGRSAKFLRDAFEARGVAFDEDEPEAAVAYAVKEQLAISEGLLRAWHLKESEAFFRDFEVLGVEQEGRTELGDGIILMFRPDGLVREKSSGDIYILSWKSCSMFGKMTSNSCSTDTQSMSEVLGVQQTTGMKIEGVLYKFLVKGQRRMDNWLGFKTQSTPLAYAWMRPGPTTEDTEWAHSYSFTTDDGRNTKLGKGFRKVSVWDNYPGGMKAWVEALAAQEITPRHENVLEGIFPQMMPVSRRADEIESWRRQTVAGEQRIRQAVEVVSTAVARDIDQPYIEALIDAKFPQHTARCFDWASKCQFFDICWSPSVKDDPLGSGLYQIRISNHPEKQNEDE